MKNDKRVSVTLIESRIRVIRGQKVMLDSDLAVMYDVTTGRLNEAVKRNNDRFPDDFMFQLTAKETELLISHLRYQKTGAADAEIRRTPSQSKVLRCCRASSEANVRCRSTYRSCACS